MLSLLIDNTWVELLVEDPQRTFNELCKLRANWFPKPVRLGNAMINVKKINFMRIKSNLPFGKASGKTV